VPNTAKELANAIQAWAEQSGFLYGNHAVSGSRPLLSAVFPHEDLAKTANASRLLEKAEITGVLFDDPAATVTVLTRGHLGPRQRLSLPQASGGITVNWIDAAYPTHSNPPAVPPLPPQRDRCFFHNGRIACGSSITAALTFNAGTLGCLVRKSDGTICGLSNNHVTGGCNHMAAGIPILSPAPIDATPHGVAPLCIGRHLECVPLQSGQPPRIVPQNHDAALFTVESADRVTSMQGTGHYDTPSSAGPLSGNMRVKKVGRTTGLTTGLVTGEYLTLVRIPYDAPEFAATVWFEHVFGVISDTPDVDFSTGGDSGSLVVSEDGLQALGIVFASWNSVSLVLPLQPLLTELNLSLVSAHNT
jgi:hypothetical protein